MTDFDENFTEYAASDYLLYEIIAIFYISFALKGKNVNRWKSALNLVIWTAISRKNMYSNYK